MKTPRRLLGALLLGAVSLMAADVPPAPLSDAESAAWVAANLDTVMQKKDFPASHGFTLPYRLFVPADYSAAKKYPLLVYLHGRGERGIENGARLYNNSGLFQGSRSIVGPNMQHRFPCIVLVPQCSDKTVNEEWARWVGNTPETPFLGLGKDGSYVQAAEPSDSGRAVLELIDTLLRDYAIDAHRVYLTGISMGGFGTWEYIMRRPELFAAAVPMAGYSDPSKEDRVRSIPIWIFHGSADEYNPVQGSRTMYRLLRAAGANVRYTEYPDTKHGDTFKKAWAEPGLLPWIFAQRKP